MRFVQTFWTAGQDPLKYAFGWTHPEYNLMSWTLSCLSLRKHYDEVELYTDSIGYHVLIEILKLPYTKVHVIFDNFHCLPQHWALAKIRTYSIQTEPFVHVDGDVYIPRPLPENIICAPLIAQNREIGTCYYRHMMDRILQMDELKLPECILKGLQEESIASYNMGVFGGSDLIFIKKYCDEVYNFIKKNRINDAKSNNSWIDCNVFFEQVIFAVLSDYEQQKVMEILGYPINDEGYTVEEFCNLRRYNEKNFFHLLGGHKRNQIVIDNLEKTILRINPSLYKHIMDIFPQRHIMFTKVNEENTSYLSMEKSISQWEDFLDAKETEWRNIPQKILFNTERAIAHSSEFCIIEKNNRKNILIKKNSYFYLYIIPKNWHPKAIQILKERFNCKKQVPLTMIGLIPTIRHTKLRIEPIQNMDLRIIQELENEVLTLEKLQTQIIKKYRYKTANDIKGAYIHIFSSVSKLLNAGFIHITN